MSEFKLICAGFGGQGVLSLGKFIATAAMKKGMFITWLPSYGPEMRGGTANCSLVLSGEEIGSPVVATADAAIIMNRPSMDKFEPIMVKGGKMLINSSLISQKAVRTDISAHYIPANALAEQNGGGRNANVVMLGAFAKVCGAVINREEAKAALEYAFKGKTGAEAVMAAFELGYNYVK